MKACAITILATCGVILLGGCQTAKQRAAYNPEIIPSKFVAGVNNPYFPLKPGTTYRYRTSSSEGTEEVTVFVTNKTKVILGVTCVVVHDVVKTGGQSIEDTWDWYAQDTKGNVWYFGEDTKQYEDETVSTRGSWEAGANGAKPGIVMPANPEPGPSYRQEYLPGTAEDMAQVLAVGESVVVPYGSFNNCIKTKDWSPLEPDVIENKYFALGVGQVLAEIVQGGREREELVDIAK